MDWITISNGAIVTYVRPSQVIYFQLVRNVEHRAEIVVPGGCFKIYDDDEVTAAVKALRIAEQCQP